MLEDINTILALGATSRGCRLRGSMAGLGVSFDGALLTLEQSDMGLGWVWRRSAAAFAADVKVTSQVIRLRGSNAR